MNRDETEMPDTCIPFGGVMGSADSLVFDTDTGAIGYWDHEEEEVEPIAPSLEALLSRTRA